MKINVIFLLILIAGFQVLSGCRHENTELKKEAGKIAGAMCKSIEAMKKLRAADKSDSVLIGKLQSEYQIVESEMKTINDAFRSKYAEQTTNREFNETFRKYLSESMLDCKSLSEAERESFEMGTK